MSPVARWHRQWSFLSCGDCVPLPHPGGPAAWARCCVPDYQAAVQKKGQTYEDDVLLWLGLALHSRGYVGTCLEGQLQASVAIPAVDLAPAFSAGPRP